MQLCVRDFIYFFLQIQIYPRICKTTSVIESYRIHRNRIRYSAQKAVLAMSVGAISTGTTKSTVITDTTVPGMSDEFDDNFSFV